MSSVNVPDGLLFPEHPQKVVKRLLAPKVRSLLEAIHYGDHLSIRSIAADLQKTVASL